MKKLSLLLFVLLCYACDEDLAVRPDGSDMQVAEVITETETEVEDQVFMVVEEQPSFPGGMSAWSQYLINNLKYPAEAKVKGIEGKVFITFIVDKDGSLSDFTLLRGIGAGCDEEALTAIMNSPNWEPGKQRGREVKTRMQVAITFQLDEPIIEEVEIPVKKNDSE